MPIRTRSLRLILGFVTIAISLATACRATGLTSDQVRAVIASLQSQIARHDQLYHRDAAPEITDFTYDQLKRKLRDLERAYPNAAANAGGVGDVADDRGGRFDTARHRAPMLSLDKTYVAAELREFQERVEKRVGRTGLSFVVEPKFDGLAVSVTYEKGRLVRALTRGNGMEGDDITRNVLLIAEIPQQLVVPNGLTPPDRIEVRGEIYVPLAEFERINRERVAAGETPFANPRNLAAGTMRQLDPDTVIQRRLAAVFYGYGVCDPLSVLPKTQAQLHDSFRRWGLPAVDDIWEGSDATSIWAAVQAIGRARKDFDFPTDGAVVKLNLLASQRDLGVSASAPRWAMAFKFEPERVETQVRAIKVQIGRTGVLTPVAELAPVELGGATITRATLHNRAEIARKDIRVGDYVLIEKAGEIVPAVIGVNLERRTAGAAAFQFPEKCPDCRASVITESSEAVVRCPNPDCAGKLQRRLEHFASAEGVNIPGLGTSLIAQLVARGALHRCSDIYRLSPGDFNSADRLSTADEARVLRAIEQSRGAELWRVINGLGISHVGPRAAREFANRFGTLQRFLSGGDYGDTMAGRAVAEYVTDAGHHADLQALIEAGVGASGGTHDATPPAGRLHGKVFALSGTLPHLTRSAAVEKIERAGGRVATTITASTTVLVAGTDAGAKLDRARAAGIEIVDEAGLRRMLGDQ